MPKTYSQRLARCTTQDWQPHPPVGNRDSHRASARVQLFLCSLSRVPFFATRDYSQPVSPSMEFPRQEYGSGLPFPTPGHLPNPGIEPESLGSPTIAGGFFTTHATWEAQFFLGYSQKDGLTFIQVTFFFQLRKQALK